MSHKKIFLTQSCVIILVLIPTSSSISRIIVSSIVSHNSTVHHGQRSFAGAILLSALFLINKTLSSLSRRIHLVYNLKFVNCIFVY